jgi:hypothetical protein
LTDTFRKYTTSSSLKAERYMKSLYQVAYRTASGHVVCDAEVYSREGVKDRILSLNQRNPKGLDYFACCVELADLSPWQIVTLYQKGLVKEGELLQFAGAKVAEQALAYVAAK